MEITKAELVGRMFEDIPTSIDYWVRGATFAVSEGVCEITETAGAWGDLHDSIIITPEGLERATDLWCTQNAKGHSHDYFDAFAKKWLEGDYAAADYDAGVIDQIVQWASFGEVRFA